MHFSFTFYNNIYLLSKKKTKSINSQRPSFRFATPIEAESTRRASAAKPLLRPSNASETPPLVSYREVITVPDY